MKYRYQPWWPDVQNKCGQEGRIPKLEATNTFRILESIKVFTDLGNILWRTVPVTLRKLHAHAMSPRESGKRKACNASIKQDRQCTYNVTLRRVRVPTVAVGKQGVLHNRCVCVCFLSFFLSFYRYTARNERTPYCKRWPVPPYSIVPHYLINGTT